LLAYFVDARVVVEELFENEAVKDDRDAEGANGIDV